MQYSNRVRPKNNKQPGVVSIKQFVPLGGTSSQSLQLRKQETDESKCGPGVVLIGEMYLTHGRGRGISSKGLQLKHDKREQV